MTRLLKLLNRILAVVAVLSILVALVFSSYALWSNHRVYKDAEDVFNQLLQLKPLTAEDSAEDKPDFSQLKAINPDVCGWITLAGTKIDYPILQGTDNLVYLNRNVYGNFSLAGSIFLDSRNGSELLDAYSIVYGHHMSNDLMFGDLDLYKDKEFFEANHSATVITGTSVKDMKVLAVLEVQASEDKIFSPSLWGSDLSGLAEYVEQNAIQIWDEALKELKEHPTSTQAVALVTCSDGSTGNRTVVILIIRRPEQSPTNPSQPSGSMTKPESSLTPPYKTGDSLFNSPVLWLCVFAVSIIALFTGWKILMRKI